MAAELRVEPVPDRPQAYRLVGEVDLSNATQLARLGSNEQDLFLDLSELAFMDSTGLRALIDLARSRPPDRQVVVARPSEAIQRLFDITGVDRIPNLRIESG